MNREFRKLFTQLAWTLTALALSMPSRSYAADWKIIPSLNLKETYSDNVRLSQPGTEKSDFITQVSPGIAVSATGARLKMNASYMMQNTAYARESSRITTNHQLNGSGNAELIEHLFFLDGRASLAQQNISLFGAQPTDNTNITGNRASVGTYSISPYLRHRFDGIATSELRYIHDEVRTRVGGLSNSKGDSALLNVSSGPAFRRIGWGLHYNKNNTEYANNSSFDVESYSGDLSYQVTPKFSLKATKGYEKYNYLTAGSSPEGGTWTAGFAWSPSSRTSLEASTGHRTFGKTSALAATHRSRNTVWSIGYSEDITTTRSQFQSSQIAAIPATASNANLLYQVYGMLYPERDPALRKQDVDNAIQHGNLSLAFPDNRNYLTNRVFLQKQLQATVALNSAKSTVVLSAYSNEREAQTASAIDSLLLGSGNLSLNDRTKTIGGNAMLNWRFASRTSANARVGHTRNRSLSTGLTTNYLTMGLGLTRQIRPKVAGTVELRRNQADSNQSGSNYRENAIFANLHMVF